MVAVRIAVGLFFTAAVSIVITLFLLYMYNPYNCINYVKSSRRTVQGAGELSSIANLRPVTSRL